MIIARELNFTARKKINIQKKKRSVTHQTAYAPCDREMAGEGVRSGVKYNYMVHILATLYPEWNISPLPGVKDFPMELSGVMGAGPRHSR